MAVQKTHRRTTKTEPNRQVSLAVVFVCIVSIVMLITGAVVEGTPAVLVVFPTLVAALTIARMRS